MSRPNVPIGDDADRHLQLALLETGPEPAGQTEPLEKTVPDPTGQRAEPLHEGAGVGVLISPEHLEQRRAGLVATAAGLATGGVAPATRLAYGRAWVRFERWCTEIGAEPPWYPISARLLVLYLAELHTGRSLSLSAIRREVAGLRWHHRQGRAEWPGSDPIVVNALDELSRRLGTTAENPKRPISGAELAAMIGALPTGPAGTRDRAVLSLGWHTGLRRSELVSLEWRDLEWLDGALVVCSRKGKTRQRGEIEFYGLPLRTDPIVCPVRCLERWRAVARPAGQAGPVFVAVDRSGHLRGRPLSGRDVARILGRAAILADLPKRAALGAHSLRRGVIVELRKRGVSLEHVAAHIGHRSIVTTAGYSRPLDAVSSSPLQYLDKPIG